MSKLKLLLFTTFSVAVIFSSNFQLLKTFNTYCKSSVRSFISFCNSVRYECFLPEVTLVGRVKMADGLGRIVVEALTSISKEKYCNVISYDNDLKGIPDNLKNKIKFQADKLGKFVIYFDPIWIGDSRFDKKFDLENLFKEEKPENQIRIAYSMYEASKIPQEWVIKINSYFDYVLVPDEYLIDVYQNSGVIGFLTLLILIRIF